MELRYKDLAAEGRVNETVSHDGCLCCLVIEVSIRQVLIAMSVVEQSRKIVISMKVPNKFIFFIS